MVAAEAEGDGRVLRPLVAVMTTYFGRRRRTEVLISWQKYSRDPTSGTTDQQGGDVAVATVTVQPPPVRPDFNVTDVTGQDVSEGREMVFTSTVKKIGAAAAPASKAEVWLSSQSSGSGAVNMCQAMSRFSLRVRVSKFHGW